MEKYGSAPKKVMAIFGLMGVLFAFFGFIGWLKSTPAKYGREDTKFYALPIASGSTAKLSISEQLTIDDRSSYAENEMLPFYQYTRYTYDDDMLIAEADYDENGSLFQWTMWEYDTAGNVRTEQTGNGPDVIRTYTHFYEYDSSGKCVHEEIYRDDDLMKNNYFRHTDIGCAGVSYSYLDNQADGGISDSYSLCTEFLEDKNGNTLCVLQFNSRDKKEPCEVWKMQWTQQGSQIVNCVRLNYEWKNEHYDFCLTPSFYRAQYDEDRLSWQMLYSDGKLAYYGACRYDTDGRIEIVVEYDTEKEKPYALLHRYERPEENIIEEYVYEIQGQEFSHLFGGGENVLLTFSETGILSGIEMTDAAGSVLEKYEFTESGENAGKIEKMYTGTDVITGEDAVLEKLEEEAGIE